MAKDGPNIVSNSTAATFGNSPQKTGEPVDRLSIYSGKGLDFDGVSDYLVTPIWYHINSTAGNYTIACWVRINSAPSNNYKAHWARDDGYIYHVPAGSLSNLSVRVRLAAPDGSWALQASSTEAQVLGVWARIVVTYEYGNEVKIYINGKLDSTHSVTSDLQTGYGIANIGGHGSSGNYGDMSLSDWQLWTGANSVWSLADVQYDYLNPEKLATENASTSLTISDLTRWHPMNDTGITNPQTVVFDGAGTNNTTKNHAATTFFGDDLLASANGDLSSWADSDSINTWTQKDSNHNGGGGVISQVGSGESSGGSGTGSANFHTSSPVSMFIRSGSIFDIGKTYSFTVEVSQYTSGTIRITGGSDTHDFTSSGTLTGTLTPTTNSYITIQGSDVAKFTIDSVVVKEIGIATGWTDADQQQTIPQTAFMDGCVKLVGPENNSSNVSPHFTLDSTGTTTSGTAYSVSAWLIRTTTPGATDNYLIGHLSTDRIYFASATQVFWKTDNTGTTINLGVTLEANVWEFWTFVSDGGTKRIYRNAQELVTSSQSPSNGFDYSLIGVGLGQESTTGFEGIIDELAIWDTILSPTEVTELYNNGLPLNATKHSKYTTSASNLKAYWKNNHLNSDGKMKDQVGSNHATITETGDSFEKIFFQQGVTANLCTQGYSNNIVHPSKGATYSNGVSDYMDLNRDIEIEGDFMVMFWFKGDPSDTPYLFGAGNLDYLRITDEDTLLLKMNNTNETIDLESGTDIGVEQWHHIAITRTGASGTIKIYFDNVAQTTDTEVSTETLKIRTLMRKGLGSGNYGKGMIDDFYVYDNFNENAINKNYKHGKSQHKNS